MTSATQSTLEQVLILAFCCIKIQKLVYKEGLNPLLQEKIISYFRRHRSSGSSNGCGSFPDDYNVLTMKL